MISSSKLKSVDFYRKIPRDLTEASLSGAGLSIVAALAMILLFGMELPFKVPEVGSEINGIDKPTKIQNLSAQSGTIFTLVPLGPPELSNYFAVSTTTSVIVDRSLDGDFVRIEFDISFPALSCEFASVDVSDVLGTNRLNITKTVRKFSIGPDLKSIGSEFHSGPVTTIINHGDAADDEIVEDSVLLTAHTFDTFSNQYPILVVNFYAPWCFWSNRLKPSWEKAAKIIRERYVPEKDGRIILAKVNCMDEGELCRRHHIQGYPSIRIFRKGSDVREDHGHHEHEAYYGNRDTESLVAAMEALVTTIPQEMNGLPGAKSENSSDVVKRPAPVTGGCRIEGFVRVKKVPGNLIVSARSESHSFEASQMNMSHLISHFAFGKRINSRTLSDMQRLAPYVGRSYDRLNGQAYFTSSELKENVTIEHYIQIVKTELISQRASLDDKLLEEYEYTAHSSITKSRFIPVAKFHFEFSPMQVLIEETSRSFSHFITNVCAIIGGVFTVAGILDSILHNTMRIVKKVELGKNF